MQKFTIRQKNSFGFFTFQIYDDKKQIGEFKLEKYTINNKSYDVSMISASFSLEKQNTLVIYDGKRIAASNHVTAFNSMLMPKEKEDITILKKKFMMKPAGFGNLGMEVFDGKKLIARYILKGMIIKKDVVEIYEKMTDEQRNLFIGILFYRHQYYNPKSVA